MPKLALNRKPINNKKTGGQWGRRLENDENNTKKEWKKVV